MIRMIHAEHGATHVLPQEVAEHEKLGWKRDEPAPVAPAPVTLTLRKQKENNKAAI